MKKILFAAGAAAVLSGCATAPPIDPATLAKVQEPLYCEGDSQCAAMWERAQVWVVKNSTYKIQTATGTLIETYNPTKNDYFPGYRILKEPEGSGKYRIWVKPIFNNYFPDDRLAVKLILDFKSYLKAASK